MHQSLLDQNPTILIYHRSIIFWPIPLTLTRFRLCLISLLFFSGSKIFLRKSGASSKGHVQWHWAQRLEVGIWKGQNPSHVTRCFVVMVMVEPHPSNPRCFKNPRKTKGFFLERLERLEVKWGATWTPDFNLFQQKIKRGDGSILLKFCTLQFQNWINILYMYHILDVVLKSFTFQVLSKLCWKEWGRNTSTYS